MSYELCVMNDEFSVPGGSTQHSLVNDEASRHPAGFVA